MVKSKNKNKSKEANSAASSAANSPNNANLDSENTKARSVPSTIVPKVEFSGASEGKRPPEPSPFLPPPPPPPNFTHNTSNNVYFKVQTLDEDLRVILDHDVEAKPDKITNLKMYRILVHFDPKTKSRAHHRKSLLWNAIQSDVLPLVKPYRSPEPAMPMAAERTFERDFNPLSRKTTRNQLITAIKASNPNFVIPTGSTIESLLILYKKFVDKDIKIPSLVDYIKPPKLVPAEHVDGLIMEELRMSLQYHAPHVFIHSSTISFTVLSNLYIKFVLEEEVAEDVLIRGFHYSLFRESA
ncbi:hypothetical protein DFH28DRAFT_1123430 [Melampsora americana]|nr:hypothetical protein DFH28DRAFT_1123430 [Melampsora americana]